MYKKISWAAVVLWMVVIFCLSAQVAEQSNQLSGGVTDIVVKTVEKVKPEAEINAKVLNYIIRKNAHFFCYLVLGLLAMNAFRRSGFPMNKSALLSFFLCALYAVSDEIHQLYVPGRGAKASDVFIDCAGAAAGLVIYRILAFVFGSIISRRNELPDHAEAND
jgi:VanZ family protein